MFMMLLIKIYQSIYQIDQINLSDLHLSVNVFYKGKWCREDVKRFSRLLKEHQKAVLSDGFTVLESAVIQHNLRSVSNMYENIAINQLAVLLGLSEAKVESLACDMIFQGRLKGYINQV
jgi:Asp-tRNA(Asn)/Glu-tRNA(Gln) amidotransferase C subunit